MYYKNNKKVLKYMCMAHIMQLKKTFKYIVYVTNCCVKKAAGYKDKTQRKNGGVEGRR